MKKYIWIMLALLAFTACSSDNNDVIEPADGPGAAYRAMLQGLDWGGCVKIVTSS